MTQSQINGVEITPKTIQETRRYYVDLYLACIDEAKSGAVYVNDLDSYCEWRNQGIRDVNAGKHDHSLDFLQQAYYLQTGDCVHLLS